MKIDFGLEYEIVVHCKPCGAVFEALPDKVSSGFATCPKCKAGGTLHIEPFIIEEEIL